MWVICRRLLYLSFHILSSVLFLPLLSIWACAVRVYTRRRQLLGLSPRLIWGPTPIINIKYWSQAARLQGYESKTLVFEIYKINSKNDFDLTIDDFGPANCFARVLMPYIVFAWCLIRFDIFNFFFHGGFLGSTPLGLLECQLLKLGGKKIVLMPYGSDIAVPGYLGVFEEAMFACYPNLRRWGFLTKIRVLYFSKWADFVIKNMQTGFLPRYNLFWPNHLAIDTELWQSENPNSFANGRNAEVVIVHSSNHRLIKGTDQLIKAVRELEEEGLKIRLILLEGCPNKEVKAAVSNCDIVAEQFIGGYGMSAIEGMSAGKPVLSNLSWYPKKLRMNSCLSECPIVDTPLVKIKENLRKLVLNPELRHRIGKAGREYVLKYHSYQSVGKVWDAIFKHVWQGTAIEEMCIN